MNSMQKDQAITGVIRPRDHFNRHPARPKTGLLAGVEVRLIPLRKLGKDDGPSGGWALSGADRRSKLLLRVTGIQWVASEDVEIRYETVF